MWAKRYVDVDELGGAYSSFKSPNHVGPVAAQGPPDIGVGEEIPAAMSRRATSQVRAPDVCVDDRVDQVQRHLFSGG